MNDTEQLEINSSDYPQDLQELINLYNKLKDRKDNSKDKAERNKLIKHLTLYAQDIHDLKKHYGIKTGKTYFNKQQTELHYGDLSELENYIDTYGSGDSYEYASSQGLIEQADDAADVYLTDKQKRIYYMHYKLGLSQKEIAKLLGISQQAVSRTINRITETLRVQMIADY